MGVRLVVDMGEGVTPYLIRKAVFRDDRRLVPYSQLIYHIAGKFGERFNLTICQ